MTTATTTAIASPTVNTAPAPTAAPGAQGQPAPVPFRAATQERNGQTDQRTVTLSASTQQQTFTIKGDGYMAGLTVEVSLSTSSNTATVAYDEDAPYNLIDRLIVEDSSGPIVNLTGYELYLVNLASGRLKGTPSSSSTDTNVFQQVSGTSVTTGQFVKFYLHVPIVTNSRALLGLLGNQDRAQTYSVQLSVAASGTVFTTPPTNAVTATITTYYQSYTVPQPISSTGAPQEQVPANWGAIHYMLSAVNQTAPAPGTVQYFLSRLNNTIRYLVFILRSNGSRASAQSNAPTLLALQFGSQTLYQNETYGLRREIMYQRYGFDFPNGVIVYDAIHDFAHGAGAELGDDWWHTNGVSQAFLTMNLPSGFGSTANSLTVITDDLTLQADRSSPTGLQPLEA